MHRTERRRRRPHTRGRPRRDDLLSSMGGGRYLSAAYPRPRRGRGETRWRDASAAVAAASPYISAVISQPGLNFAKDLLVSHAAETLTPLSVPGIEKSVSIPLVGTVRMAAYGIMLHGLAVDNSTVANLTMKWSYSYSAWVFTISDSGNASIQVEGMKVGVSLGMKNHNGSLNLSVMECGCYMKDLDITLNGGASWFYQVFIDGFSNHIRSSVENAITNKVIKGALKLDSFLGNLLQKIDVDSVAAMNVTFVNIHSSKAPLLNSI